MTARELYLIERVFGEFNVDSGEVLSDDFLVIYSLDKIELHYRFHSDELPDELIMESIESRVDFPELIDLILAKGEKKRSWDIHLFEKHNGQFVNIGYSRAGITMGDVHKPLFRKNVGIDILNKILQSQLSFDSKLTNSIISALRQARDSKYIEMKVIWSWYALEWYTQSKAKIKALSGILDYAQMPASEKYRTTLKKRLKTEVKEFLDEVDNSPVDNETKNRLATDAQEIRKRLSQNIFSPPIFRYIEDLSSHFESILLGLEPTLKSSDLSDFYETLRNEWNDFLNGTKSAKMARDKFSHLSLKEGSLENIRNIDSYNEVLLFMLSVIMLMLAAFTQSPQIYDVEFREIGLSPMEKKEENVSYRPTLNTNDSVTIEDSNGAYVTEGHILKDENGFLIIEVQDAINFINSGPRESFIPFAPVSGYADYHIKHESFRFVCTNESTNMSNGKEWCVFKIWKWYST